ncbi:MAG: phosphatidylglycerophosphatase A [Alphaproteobacteria bacterium]
MKFYYFSYLFSMGFGIGKFPLFPGTIASLLTLPVIWYLNKILEFKTLLILIFFYTLISIYFVNICIKNLKDKDPKYIIVDEQIGQAVALLFCDQKIVEFLISFILFRIFDIIKPFPINYVDKIKNSLGVILDDILAGIFVCILFLLI